jgi:hypothetical protein
VPIYAPTAERMRTTSSGPQVAATSTGMLPVRLNILVNIGALDLLSLYGRPLSPDPAASVGHSWPAWFCTGLT